MLLDSGDASPVAAAKAAAAAADSLRASPTDRRHQTFGLRRPWSGCGVRRWGPAADNVFLRDFNPAVLPTEWELEASAVCTVLQQPQALLPIAFVLVFVLVLVLVELFSGTKAGSLDLWAFRRRAAARADFPVAGEDLPTTLRRRTRVGGGGVDFRASTSTIVPC